MMPSSGETNAANLMTDLTPNQRAVVEHLHGPLLVLAGPGSGKTRVITRRIAHLVHQGVSPRRIVAITFTNKAAGEMLARVEELLPGQKVWISTFHRFCARLLRKYSDMVGIRSHFTILDSTDQKQLLRRILSDLDFDPIHFPPEKLLGRISQAKNDLISAEQFVARYQDRIADHWQAVLARVYPAYQQALLDSNAVDYDDLLLHVAQLLDENPELRAELDERFQHILVDEYQDTNAAQYRIVAALSQRDPNLCVTGDPDQSIYGWRGARVENILQFERDFPEATIIRLERNFRSTPAILRAADALIARNSQRKIKELLTDRAEGPPVRLWQFPHAEAEADTIARMIRRTVEQEGRAYGDCAVFFRVNSLSRLFELAFLRHGVPFQVAAGLAFYERAEVKDLLAYLRLIHNPEERAAFLRVINTPLRGLGKTSQDRLIRWADQQQIAPLQAAARADDIPRLSKQARIRFCRFAEMIGRLSLADSGSVAALLETIIEQTNYTASFANSDSEKDQEKLAYVEELIGSARSFDRLHGEETSLELFLEQAALVNDTDRLDSSQGQVTLMTLHAAKGLEFPWVAIAGIEQGLLPHERSIHAEADPLELEEERRLLFVGITRAEEELHLTYADRRNIHGQERITIPSLFLNEIAVERMPLEKISEQTHWASRRETAPGEKPAQATAVPSMDDLRSQLKTGADLLHGTTSKIDLPTGFAIGSQVRHPRYGQGTVIALSGFGRRRMVTVRFREDEREQCFDVAKSALQPIGLGGNLHGMTET